MKPGSYGVGLFMYITSRQVRQGRSDDDYERGQNRSQKRWGD